MIRIMEVEEARQKVLRRQIPGEHNPPALRAGLLRVFGEEITPQEGVRRILRDVRERGDSALQDWTYKIDGFTLEQLSVPREEWSAALERLPSELQQSLKVAAHRVRSFHARQPIPSWSTTEMGGVLGQTCTPLKRVGVYVPGGSAPLPSSLLMSAIPAKVAGVEEVWVATPPGRSNGRVPDAILAAAYLSEVSGVYCVGGAQAIAALALGTDSIPRVDKIVGAGNLFVTLAKQQVFGQVGLDGLAGPTETVVVADDSADPAWVAADLLAQAEHDMLAAPILLTPSRLLATKVQAEVKRQFALRERREILANSLAEQGGIVITQNITQAVQLADEYAPEHLCLSVENPQEWARQIRCAGGLFLGERSCEVLGDYVAGPSHVMPTGGTARFASPLNVLDFVRITNVIGLDETTSAKLSIHAARIAQAESLDSHAQAAMFRAESATSSANEIDACTTLETLRPAQPSVFDAMESYQPVAPFEVWAQRLGREPDSIVKLDANENPYGPSPKALERVGQGKGFHIYPDPDSTALRRALSAYVQVPEKYLFTGAGADELIDLVLRVAVNPDDILIDCPPTFSMYSFFARINRARVVSVPRKNDFRLDIKGVEAAVAQEPRAKVLFLCSPNNPDGSVLSDNDLRQLLRLPVLVVLDEAYVEFHGSSRISWVLENENLAVLRTFSKWAGLAGLRVGYGAFPQWLLRRMWPIKQPYNVNVAASQAAIASLEEAPVLLQTVERICQERERMARLLSQVKGFSTFPSRSNFVLSKISGGKALELKRALEEQGILVRYFQKPGVQDCLRFSVGRREDTDLLISALNRLGWKSANG